MFKMMKDALILCIITLSAGALLAGVYEITKEPIRLQEELAKQNACKEVFADATSFSEVSDVLEETQAAIEKDGFTMESIDSIAIAFDDAENKLGYVIQMREKNGYGGDITFMVGIRNDATVNGISILSINETAGLGMNADSEEFTSQFANKNVAHFTYTKNGAASENEIDALSGATVTTNAMVNGVNAALSAHSHLAKEGN